MNRSENNSREYNFGLCFLKLWMAFEVVYLHTCGFSSAWMITAVPVFMLLSFLFSTRSLYLSPKRRMVRLLYPYIFWSIVNYSFLGIMGLLIPTMPRPTVKGFFSQLICGTADLDCDQLWFMSDLIIISIIIICLHRLFSKTKHAGAAVTRVVSLLGILCLFYEKTGMDFMIQGLIKSNHRLWFLVGAALIPEMLPFVAIGMIFFETGFLLFLKKKRAVSLILATAILAWYLLKDKHPLLNGGWLYGGIGHILSAALLTVIFYLLPLDYMPNIIKQAIRFISRYTMGIFFCHIIIKQLYENMVTMLFSEGSAILAKALLWTDPGKLLHGHIEAVTVFLMSWILCFFMERILKDTGRRLVT